jgi:hypothetical protein
MSSKRQKTKDVSLLLLGTNPLYTLLPALTLGLDVQRQSYEDLLAKKHISFKSDVLFVMFFFPYKFWDTYCEVDGSDVVYGVDRDVYNRFRRFWGRVEKTLNRVYPDKRIEYIIDPKMVYVDRDKILTHNLLEQEHIPVTTTIDARTIEEVLRHVTSKRGVFIKSRYGAEGKGITRIRSNEWTTNYAVKRHQPFNHQNGKRWPFVDVTGDKKFLRDLLSRDVIVEQEILCEKKPNIGKFDVRVHVVGGKVVHLFVRHAGSQDVVTNWSQGGKVEHTATEILNLTQIKSAITVSEASAKVLNSQFVGIDCMFDQDHPDQAIVVEAQCMCDFPKPEACNLGEVLVRHILSKYR